MHKGSCLCGAVTFEVEGDLPGPDACHCGKCRKHSGHYFASTDVPRSALTIHGEDNITWYQSSEKTRRGFCSTSGSSLFFEPLLRDWIGLAMGAFDTPTDTRLAVHILVADRATTTRSPTGCRRTNNNPPPLGVTGHRCLPGKA